MPVEQQGIARSPEIRRSNLSIDGFVAALGAGPAEWAGRKSQPNLAGAAVHRATYTVGNIYSALARGEAVSAALLAENVRFWVRGEPGLIPHAGTWKGATGVAGFFDALAKNVRYTAITPRYHMIREDSKGILLFIFVLEEGTAVPTGRSFSFEAVHAWRFDCDGRIQDFEYYHHSFDLVVAFSNLVLDPSIVYRHPLPEEAITPTRPTRADPGVAAGRFYEALKALDVAGLMDLFADDAISTLEGVENVVPFSGTYRGKAEILRQVQAVGPALIIPAELFPLDEELELRYIVDGNRLCVRFTDTAIVRQGNVPLSFLNIHFFTVNDQGKIAVFRSYNDTWHVAKGCGFVPQWS